MTPTATAPLLRLDGVGKDYAKVDARGGRVRLVWDLLRGRAASRVFRALDGASFELRRGESLGVIGENGAGKSTLLKIVAGVIPPTRGRVTVGGRVGALLELGSGFHPEYTGLANIELAAALLGLAPAEIAAKRDEIVAFADIGEHINDPIKHYSSGMVVRLGFAVATTLAPDVLITDEVLAVGDESFQKKMRRAGWRATSAAAARCCCARTACTTCRSCAAARCGSRMAVSSVTAQQRRSRRLTSPFTRRSRRGRSSRSRRRARRRPASTRFRRSVSSPAIRSRRATTSACPARCTRPTAARRSC